MGEGDDGWMEEGQLMEERLVMEGRRQTHRLLAFSSVFPVPGTDVRDGRAGGRFLSGVGQSFFCVQR